MEELVLNLQNYLRFENGSKTLSYSFFALIIIWFTSSPYTSWMDFQNILTFCSKPTLDELHTGWPASSKFPSELVCWMVCKCRTVSRLYVQKKHIIKKSSLFLRRVHYLLTSCTICLRGHHVYKKTFELVNLYGAARNWPTKPYKIHWTSCTSLSIHNVKNNWTLPLEFLQLSRQRKMTYVWVVYSWQIIHGLKLNVSFTSPNCRNVNLAKQAPNKCCKYFHLR